MIIHAYTTTRHTAEMLPYVVHHYATVADALIVLDLGDSKADLAPILARYPNTTLRPVAEHVDDPAALLQEHAQASQDQADWIILVPTDALLWHPQGVRNVLAAYRQVGITWARAEPIGAVAPAPFPAFTPSAPHAVLQAATHGFREPNLGNLSVVQAKHLDASPDQTVSSPSAALKQVRVAMASETVPTSARPLTDLFVEAPLNMPGAVVPTGPFEAAHIRQGAQVAFEAGRTHHKAGHSADAETLYRHVLGHAPHHAGALNLLGLLIYEQGDADEGLHLLDQAATHQPQRPSIHNNRGTVLMGLERADEAEAAFRTALRLNPRYARAWYNLGKALSTQDQFEAALEAYERALALKPDFHETYLALAQTLEKLGRPADAEQLLHRATQHLPKVAQLWEWLGDLYRKRGHLPKAAQAYRQAVRSAPNEASMLNSLGAVLQMQGNVPHALKAYRRALRLDPDLAEARFNLARGLDEAGEAEEADAAYTAVAQTDTDEAVRALSHQATLRRKLCDWTDYEARRAHLFDAVRAHLARPNASALPALSFQLFDTPTDLRASIARHAAKQHAKTVAAYRDHAAFVHTRSHPKRLRIGYLSPDFRSHAVGMLIKDLFAAHNRDAVEVYGYALIDVPTDNYRQTIEAGCDQFTVVTHLSDYEAAQHIHADGIDVLIDMGGYTTYTRTGILALQPAPVQAHWLGYLGTMGASYLPYILADPVVLPDTHAAHYTETRVLLPDTFLPVSSMTVAETTPTRTDMGLPAETFVFASFNGPHKTDPAVFGVWMDILQRVPGSVLWLYVNENAAAETNLRRTAQAHGIDPARLVFAGRMPMPENLARHHLADLFLDPFEYNGGTTTVSALYMGKPVLTCPGTTYLSRMGASLVQAAGVPDLIQPTPQAYADAAVHLASHPTQLADLRQRLQHAQMIPTPLFDLPRLAQHLEAAYQRIWAHHHNGEVSSVLKIEAS